MTQIAPHDSCSADFGICPELRELRFLKFRLIPRIYRPKMGSRESHCPSLSSTTSATPLGDLWVRPCVVSCLAGGPSELRSQNYPGHGTNLPQKYLQCHWQPLSLVAADAKDLLHS